MDLRNGKIQEFGSRQIVKKCHTPVSPWDTAREMRKPRKGRHIASSRRLRGDGSPFAQPMRILKSLNEATPRNPDRMMERP